MLLAPVVEKLVCRVAVPPADCGLLPFRPEAGLPLSGAAVPSGVPPAKKVTVPVGAMPLLPVLRVAVSVTFWPTVTEATLGVTVIPVGVAFVMLNASAADVLGLKLLSPE